MLHFTATYALRNGSNEGGGNRKYGCIGTRFLLHKRKSEKKNSKFLADIGMPKSRPRHRHIAGTTIQLARISHRIFA